MQKLTQLLAACLALLLSDTSDGALLGVNDAHVIGSGVGETQDGFNITRDTDTNLDWLDWTLSTNRSFDGVAVEFGLGGDFEGFRFATKSDIETLILISAGVPPGLQQPPSVEQQNLANLVGRTFMSPETSGSWAIYDDSATGQDPSLLGNVILGENLPTGPRAPSTGFGIYDDLPGPPDPPVPALGFALVRPTPAMQAVPEASSLFTWLILFLISVGSRYRLSPKT